MNKNPFPPRHDVLRGLEGRAESEFGQRQRAALQNFLTAVESKLDPAHPERWWRTMYRTVLQMKKKPELVDESIREFIEVYVDFLVYLLELKGVRKSDADSGIAAQELIHDMAEFVRLPAAETQEKMEIRQVPIAELLKDTAHFNLSIEQRDGRPYRILKVRAGEHAEWSEVVLPRDDKMWHKGGIPRTILKIFARAPQHLIETELPPNDVDVVAVGERTEAQREGAVLGADPEGVELVHEFDPELIMHQRDTDMNQALLSRDHLIFSQAAFEAATTGHIRIAAQDRGIYGTENFVYEGVELIKNRGLHRLLKFVAEGKANSFSLLPLNKQVDFGIYWLTLAKKFAAKKHSAVLLERLFELGRRIGQVQDGEQNIYEVLDRVHQEYPFFRFDDAPFDQPRLALWLFGKLKKLADKRLRADRRIGLDLSLERHPGDDVPETISLDGFHPTSISQADSAEDWSAFLKRSKLRNEYFVSSPPVVEQAAEAA